VKRVYNSYVTVTAVYGTVSWFFFKILILLICATCLLIDPKCNERHYFVLIIKANKDLDVENVFSFINVFYFSGTFFTPVTGSASRQKAVMQITY